MATQRPTVAHDHVVLLLDTEHFETPPAWLADNFTIIEGGTHAGGSSRNKLIIFKDGSYLELFNWISDPTEFSDWAEKKPGLIDFALTTLPPTTAQQNYIAVAQALESGSHSGLGVAYDHPRTGGRKRKDGVDVQWEITRALFHDGPNIPDASFFPSKRLDVPFFCHDLTDRQARVPRHDDSITAYPCGAVGISRVKVLVPEANFEDYQNLYRSILGVETEQFTDELGEQSTSFAITAVHSQGVNGALSLCASPEGSTVDRGWLTERGVGIRELYLTTGKANNKDYHVKPLAPDGMGATIKLED